MWEFSMKRIAEKSLAQLAYDTLASFLLSNDYLACL